MIRKLRREDLSQIAAIEQATQPIPWTEKIFQDCFLAGYPSWVEEEEEDKVISFAIIALNGEECHLLNLGVHRAYQRRGYGRHLLEHLLYSAKQGGATMIYLEVRESNTPAIALYQKMNFTQIGIREDYYPAFEGREDGLIFARDLD
ncbi:MAG TPA: ribosomal protein S18-alanine N-acetyltransferase [Gammaproteobacteria bacterium]|nr:ribosomal protein S18-alanine N-acetyltransferase [Gammaproteobacteria bacterium]